MIETSIETELRSVGDQRAVAAVRRFLVQPQRIILSWDYGPPGQQFAGWTVLDDRAGSGAEIVFCEEGFGPSSPWGLIGDRDDDGIPSIGMDSGWFRTFTDAYFNSFAATELEIWRVFEVRLDGECRDLTGELPWDTAWTRRDELQATGGAYRYDVRQAVPIARDQA